MIFTENMKIFNIGRLNLGGISKRLTAVTAIVALTAPILSCVATKIDTFSENPVLDGWYADHESIIYDENRTGFCQSKALL